MTQFEAAAASFSSSSSTHPPWKYHVFLSFRGEDTRNNFTGHLCSALRQKGITTFMDDELTRGEEISTALLQAIEESKISIIVFSENYASSKWCLDELVKILECKKSKHQMVRPVFYKVNPSDIRSHGGSFGVALANHEREFKDNLDKVEKWKTALSEAANLAGWPLSIEHSESKLIHDITEEISDQVMKNTFMNVAKYPVGLEPRVRDINKLLGVQGRDVCMVGIWGTGGIGKTTIAKAVYNSIAHNFEGSCFLECVRENSACSGGLVKQQENLLFEILGRKELKLTNAAMGITTIKDRLSNRKVLLVLDDVSNLNQLNNLAGEHDWFGKGSRIIITTRDKGLLISHDVYLIYNVKELDHHDAIELFSWHAFKRKEPLEVYAELTKRAIGYAQGLPLALRVLGSHLCGRNLVSWETTLDGFKSTPEIQEILKVSYDALPVSAKEVFLDIACFYKCGGRKYLIEILKGCGLNSHYGINVLIEMSLVNIDEHDCIRMHDLLEQMGKDIVHQESPNDPGQRSRLWFHEDVHHVLTENTGTAKITGIKVELPEISDEICLRSTSFSNMRNLRLFIHQAGCISGVLDYLPNSLRVVDWPNCPFRSLPSNFNPRNLAVLNMPKSRLEVFNSFKNLKNLRSVDLNHCKYLTKVSDLSGIPNLQTLRLGYCTNLVEVHPSVGFLTKLMALHLDDCSSLAVFPTRVSWKSLQILNLGRTIRLENFIEIMDGMDSVWRMDLSGSGIKRLPSWIGYLTSLKVLHLAETPIEELPSSIGNLIELEKLFLYDCVSLTKVPQSIYGLQHLTHLNLSGCPKLVTFPNRKRSSEVASIEESVPLMHPANSNISHDNCGSLLLFPRLRTLQFEGCNLLSLYDFLDSLDCKFSLRRLNLSNTDLVSVPDCIRKFVGLRRLELHGCESLREIVELPPFIEDIDVGSCVSLEMFPALSRILEHNDTLFLKSMDLSNCHRLLDFDVVSEMADAAELNEVVSKMAKSLVLNQVYKKSAFEVIIPGNEVPEWFDCRKDEVNCVLIRLQFPKIDHDICELRIEIPRSLKWKKTGLVVCALFEATPDYSDDCLFGLIITINEVDMNDRVQRYELEDMDFTWTFFFRATATKPSAHVWLKYIPLEVDIKKEVDRKSDPNKPYLCRLSFIYLNGEGYLFKSCGVHLAYVPDDDDDDEEEEEEEEEEDGDDDGDDGSSEDSQVDLDLDCGFGNAKATVSGKLVLSGGVSTKRGVEHCDQDEDPGPCKRFKQITHDGAEPNASGGAL